MKNLHSPQHSRISLRFPPFFFHSPRFLPFFAACLRGIPNSPIDTQNLATVHGRIPHSQFPPPHPFWPARRSNPRLSGSGRAFAPEKLSRIRHSVFPLNTNPSASTVLPRTTMPSEILEIYKSQVNRRAKWFAITVSIGTFAVAFLVHHATGFASLVWKVGLMVQGFLFWPRFVKWSYSNRFDIDERGVQGHLEGSARQSSSISRQVTNHRLPRTVISTIVIFLRNNHFEHQRVIV